MTKTKFQNDDVQNKFASYPKNFRQPLLAIREFIFSVASNTQGVGPLTETLKWGQPSFLTEETGAGTTIRLDQFDAHHVALFFHCQTTLVEAFRDLFPDMKYSKNRAILINISEPLPENKLRMCIELALTYKLKKN